MGDDDDQKEREKYRDEMSAVQFMVVETRQNVMQSQHNTKYDRCITNININTHTCLMIFSHTQMLMLKPLVISRSNTRSKIRKIN